MAEPATQCGLRPAGRMQQRAAVWQQRQRQRAERSGHAEGAAKLQRCGRRTQDKDTAFCRFSAHSQDRSCGSHCSSAEMALHFDGVRIADVFAVASHVLAVLHLPLRELRVRLRSEDPSIALGRGRHTFARVLREQSAVAVAEAVSLARAGACGRAGGRRRLKASSEASVDGRRPPPGPQDPQLWSRMRSRARVCASVQMSEASSERGSTQAAESEWLRGRESEIWLPSELAEPAKRAVDGRRPPPTCAAGLRWEPQADRSQRSWRGTSRS